MRMELQKNRFGSESDYSFVFNILCASDINALQMAMLRPLICKNQKKRQQHCRMHVEQIPIAQLRLRYQLMLST